jgi:hypothetical protein
LRKGKKKEQSMTEIDKETEREIREENNVRNKEIEE